MTGTRYLVIAYLMRVDCLPAECSHQGAKGIGCLVHTVMHPGNILCAIVGSVLLASVMIPHLSTLLHVHRVVNKERVQGRCHVDLYMTQ